MKILVSSLLIVFFLTGCTELDTPQTNSPQVPTKPVAPIIEEQETGIEEVDVLSEILDVIDDGVVNQKKAEEIPTAPVVEQKETKTQETDILNDILKTIEEKKPEVPKIKNTPPSTKSNCHPSYSGCLKADASDYDCAGGSGNGPYYTGTVRVVGPDVFGLDRDNDGWGCE